MVLRVLRKVFYHKNKSSLLTSFLWLRLCVCVCFTEWRLSIYYRASTAVHTIVPAITKYIGNATSSCLTRTHTLLCLCDLRHILCSNKYLPDVIYRTNGINYTTKVVPFVRLYTILLHPCILNFRSYYGALALNWV